MSRPDLQAAIKALEQELAITERQAADMRGMINMLCQRAGLGLRYPENDVIGHAAAPANIKPDTFYGKKMQTAAREFLEMRKLADRGPAKPREIYDALKEGGYQFEAKDESTALVGLRATLRKNSGTFHKLPNGEYGLRAWYGDVRLSKGVGEEDGQKQKKARKGKATKGKTAKGKAPQKSTNALPNVSPFVGKAILDGERWTTMLLREEAISQDVPGVDENTKLTAFHRALMGLKNRGLVQLVEKGVWRAVKPEGGSGHGDPRVVPMKAASG